MKRGYGDQPCLRGLARPGPRVRKVQNLVTTRALLLENIHPDASARLVKEGYQVDTLPRALGQDELIEAIGDVSLLGIR